MNDDREDRRKPIAKPAEQRTADQSTQEAGGLHDSLQGVRPGPGPELAREADADDVLNRNEEDRYETPRNYDEDENRDATMPANDSSLNTKI
jgi:hypothetical protein